MLFCRERDPERELWDGLRAGQDGAIASYGADDAFPIGDIDDILPGLIEGRERVYYAIGCNQEFDQRLMEWINHIRAKARQGLRRRTSSSPSTTCCTTCACTSRLPR